MLACSGQKEDTKTDHCVTNVHSKTFSNENVHQDHLRSKKHKEKVLHGVKNIQVDGLVKPAAVEDENMGQAGAAESSSSSSAMPKLDANSCLFCPRTFSDLETNLKHMGHNHSFYVPDLAYCVDIPGLLAHLGQDIALGNICIFCHHGFGGLVTGNETDSELVKRARRGLESVRKHMTDKGHCRLAFETDAERLEVSDYYDYRSSYPDAADHPDSDEEELMDQDWEDEDGSEVDENDEVIMDYSAVRRKTRTAKDEDLDMRRQIGENDYELVLPNGQRVGHRALRGIYKQNLMRKCDYRAIRRLVLTTMVYSTHQCRRTDRQGRQARCRIGRPAKSAAAEVLSARTDTRRYRRGRGRSCACKERRRGSECATTGQRTDQGLQDVPAAVRQGLAAREQPEGAIPAYFSVALNLLADDYTFSELQHYRDHLLQ